MLCNVWVSNLNWKLNAHRLTADEGYPWRFAIDQTQFRGLMRSERREREEIKSPTVRQGVRFGRSETLVHLPEGTPERDWLGTTCSKPNDHKLP